MGAVRSGRDRGGGGGVRGERDGGISVERRRARRLYVVRMVIRL